MKKFLIFLVKKIIPYLKKNGVDIKSLFPDEERSIYDMKIDSLKNEFNALQADISVKRVSIIDAQKILIQNAESMLFSTLGSEDADFWKKSTFTKVWLDNVIRINELIDEHQDLMEQFDMTYHQIEKLKKQKQDQIEFFLVSGM